VRGEVLSSEEVVGRVGDSEKMVWSLAIEGVLYMSSRGEGMRTLRDENRLSRHSFSGGIVIQQIGGRARAV
jgi:hypothetical protein